MHNKTAHESGINKKVQICCFFFSYIDFSEISFVFSDLISLMCTFSNKYQCTISNKYQSAMCVERESMGGVGGFSLCECVCGWGGGGGGGGGA